MNPRPAALLLCLVLGACRAGPTQGTSVGNPGETRMSVARGTGLTTETAAITVVRTVWTDCVGVTTMLEVEQALDLLDPVVLDSPPGSWCRLDIRTRGPLALEATSDAGFEADLSLALGTVSVATRSAFFVDGNMLALELGSPGWLDAAELGVDGGDVVITEASAEHGLLVARVLGEAALYEDDGDGAVSEDERGGGAVADAASVGEDDDDDDDDGDDDDDAR